MVIGLLKGSSARPVAAAAVVVAGVAAPLVTAAPAHADGSVTVQVTGQGRVTASGIDCTASGGPDCSEFYADEVEQICDPEQKPPCGDYHLPPTVDFTAAPGINGYALSGWTGCDSNPSPTTCQVTVTGPATVRADYADVQAPQPPFVSVARIHVRDTVDVNASTSDNSGQVTRVEFRRAGVLVATDTTAPFAAVVDTTSAPEGSLQLTAIAYDGAGHQSSPGRATVTVDRTAPAVSVTSGPDGDTLRGGVLPKWTFSVAQPPPGDQHTTLCSVLPSDQIPDRNDWRACTGPDAHTADPLDGDGSYTFRGAANDRAGNRTEVARTFSIDGTAPITTITKGPRKVVKTRTRRAEARFAFASSEAGSSYRCSLDGSRYRACSTKPVFRVKQGRHVLRVRAVDSVGNLDASPAVWRWRVVRRR